MSPELDKALEATRKARPDAMIVFPEGATMANRVGLANFALAHRLPSMFGWSEYAAAGGLMSYGASQRDAHARLARQGSRSHDSTVGVGPPSNSYSVILRP
jgi:putative ABC transport system substrate-binding protein